MIQKQKTFKMDHETIEETGQNYLRTLKWTPFKR